MPKPNRNQIAQFRAFQRRQARYEKQYTKQLFLYLRKCYFSSAKEIQTNGLNADIYPQLDVERLERILTSLYKKVILEEAKMAYTEMIYPYEQVNRLQTKDILDDLAEILSGNNSNLIRVWRSLLDDFVELRLTGKIQRITTTTLEKIARIIETGKFEGLGQEEVARMIRERARELGEGNIRKLENRSRAIARTETIVSANQGKYIAALSSNLQLKKKWLPTLDARTRDGKPGREANHRIMFDKDWIPLKQDFLVPNDVGINEQALYPGDPRLSAGNVINCRCSIIFQPMRDNNGNVIRKR